MSKTQKKVTKQVSSSSEEDSSDNNNDEDQELMIGDGNAMGGFDDKRIDSTNEEAARKRKEAKEGNIIHLNFQQRTVRKCLTIVTGLPDDLDFRKMIRAFKKAWCCNGTVVENQQWGSVLQLQGDRRRDIYKFLIEEGIASKENIKVHGA